MGALVGSWELASGWGKGEPGGAPLSSGALFRSRRQRCEPSRFSWELLPSFLSWVTLDELVYLCSVPNLLDLGKGPGIVCNSPDVPSTPSQTVCQGEGEQAQGTGSHHRGYLRSPSRWAHRLAWAPGSLLVFWCPSALSVVCHKP